MKVLPMQLLRTFCYVDSDATLWGSLHTVPGWGRGFNESSPLPFRISIARTQSIEQRIIDETVIYLFRIAESFGGEYTGWETPVVTQ
jgi:hypothetical protein